MIHRSSARGNDASKSKRSMTQTMTIFFPLVFCIFGFKEPSKLNLGINDSASRFFSLLTQNAYEEYKKMVPIISQRKASFANENSTFLFFAFLKNFHFALIFSWTFWIRDQIRLYFCRVDIYRFESFVKILMYFNVLYTN